MTAKPEALPLTGPAPVAVRTSRGAIECAMGGQGPAILAVHGGMAGHDQSWLLARALLTDPARHRVIAVSRPGYLGTSLDPARTPDEQADLYAALLDALEIPKASVVAVSAGGPSAIAFAARHPSRCRALVLISACTGRLTTPRDIMARLRTMRILARVPGLAAVLNWGAARNPEAGARRAIPDARLRECTLRHPEAGSLLRALQSSVFERMAARLPGTINDIEQFGTLGQLPHSVIAAPTLIVHGTADNVVPFAHAENARQTIPHAELLSVAHGEHVCLFTHLDLVREQAARYLGGG